VSGSFLLYTVLVLALSILLTWCYNNTDGSVMLAMLLHAGFNSSGAFVPVPMEAIERSPATIDAGITAGVWVVVVAVIAWAGTETLSRRGPSDGTVAGREFDRGRGGLRAVTPPVLPTPRSVSSRGTDRGRVTPRPACRPRDRPKLLVTSGEHRPRDRKRP